MDALIAYFKIDNQEKSAVSGLPATYAGTPPPKATSPPTALTYAEFLNVIREFSDFHGIRRPWTQCVPRAPTTWVDCGITYKVNICRNRMVEKDGVESLQPGLCNGLALF